MSGIYFHIPYCKQACHYCDFHFSTVLSTRDDLLKAMRAELSLRKNARMEGQLQSIYFGGGTPSILSVDELKSLLDDTYEHFSVAPDAEITLEANPDDLHNADKLRAWRDMGINRLSIGLQSFHDADLKWMNRAHNAGEALAAVERARAAGFDRLTLDLIYGLPHWHADEWAQNLDTLFSLGVDHFSAYILTVEDNTALGKNVARGKQRVTDDNAIEAQYQLLCERAKAAGYSHYEVSNFGLPGRMAAHNSAYWRGEHYLGIGPGAHSFDGQTRRWNIASNPRYLKLVGSSELWYETEQLTPIDRHNERLLTRLRTSRGIDLADFIECGSPAEHPETAEVWKHLLDRGDLVLTDSGRYRIPEHRWLVADGVAGDLFVLE